METVFSGPAGGVRAAVHIGKLIGRPDVLSFDIGGTSTDVALSRGRTRRGGAPQLADRVLQGPRAVAGRGGDRRGGGSIAHVPVTGALRVGPESAGSKPGPACVRARRRGAHRDRRERGAGLSAEPARRPDGVHRDLADRRSQQRGHLSASRSRRPRGRSSTWSTTACWAVCGSCPFSGPRPREFTLFAFGGAGPLHANALMELLGSPVTVVPAAPGVFSTSGSSSPTCSVSSRRSHIRRLSRVDKPSCTGSWTTWQRGNRMARRQRGFAATTAG